MKVQSAPPNFVIPHPLAGLRRRTCTKQGWKAFASSPSAFVLPRMVKLTANLEIGVEIRTGGNKFLARRRWA